MKRNAILTGLLFAAVLLAGTFTGFQDWKLLTNSTGNPASGYLRMFGNNSTGTIDMLNSSGSHLYFPSNFGASYNTGNLGVSHLNSGTSASGTTFWAGDGTWKAPFTLTTTGTSGAATFSSGTLNIPQYSGGGGAPTTMSANLAGSSRAFGTVYRNTGTSPIYVSVWGNTTVADQIHAYIDSFSPPTDIVNINSIASSGTNASVFVIVLPGYYYKVDYFSGTRTLLGWYEWM